MTKDATGKTAGGGRRARRMATAAWTRRLPVAFLLLALTISGFGGLEAYRTQRSHAATTSSLLEDYGGFAAFTYQQRSWQLLGQALDRPLSVARNSRVFRRGEATHQCLTLILDERGSCDCATEITGAYSFFTRVGEPVASSMWAGTTPKSSTRSAIVSAVQEHARTVYGQSWPHAIAFLDAPEGAVAVAYTVIESPIVDTTLTVKRDSVIYGFEVDRERLGHVLASALDDEVLLPPSLTRDRPNDEVIAVEVLSPDGELLFASHPDVSLPFASETRRRDMFGSGTIRASVLPQVADQLIIGGLPGNRTPLFVLIFGVAGALAVMAIVQLRREDRLALLRQDFVASVSHELRTPLAQVRLFTETLRLGRTRTPEQESWALENIDRESQRLATLVDNILHFSRSERGVAAIDPEPGDLAGSVREAITSFGRLLPPEKATIETDIPETLPAAIHPDSIRQVVLNLLDNAVRYGPSGQVIRVTGARGGNVVRISVDDEGPGVPPSDRERIFEPFLRGDQSLGTVVVGSGIGLSVVREIVRAHGGRVWVEDRPGGGARFVFELPLLHTAEPAHFALATKGATSESGVA